jgi:hypothetical protein
MYLAQQSQGSSNPIRVVLPSRNIVGPNDESPESTSTTPGWTKGDRLGVLEEGTKIAVAEVALIPAKGGGYRVWIKT